MKKTFLVAYCFLAILLGHTLYGQTQSFTVNFPKDYEVGDYVEFVKLNPLDAGSSGFYEVSISYTRTNVAAASTHLVSVGHHNPSIWREAGKIYANPYVGSGNLNFTIDCNTLLYQNKLRIRAIKTLGNRSVDLPVNIKIRAIGGDAGMQALDVRGRETGQVGLLPMTDEWDLIVGQNFTAASGVLAIKAISNGNVGIGTANPDEKLTVKGKIRAQEIKVEATNWPDYVFKKDYELTSLEEIDQYIKQYGHLPEIPKAVDVQADGVSLGEMNKLLLKKIEELTLHLIEQQKENQDYKKRIMKLEEQINRYFF